MPQGDAHPIARVLARVLHEAKGLLTTEAALAKRELKQNFSKARTGLILVAVALLFGLVTVHGLAIVTVLTLAEMGLSLSMAALIAFGAFLALTLVFAVWALRCLSPKALMPTQTLKNLKTDIEMLKEPSDVKDAA